MIAVHVPDMSSRQSVRRISARVCDVPGVQTVQVDVRSRTVRIAGPADPAAVVAAISAAGFSVTDSDTLLSATTPQSGRSAMDTFTTDVTGLRNATRPEVIVLDHGAELTLRPGPVAKRLGDAVVRMLGYNDAIPGPTLKVRQGSEIVVHVINGTDIDTTVHWHGLRLENRYDGVPHETQDPIPPGGEFTYRIQFPDPGLYWYHPHIREDVTQELGLSGSILVEPAEADYWPPAHRDVVLTVDDVLVEDGAIAPFSRKETNYAAMGRYGNVMLVDGETDLALTARTGEVVRLWLTNTANSRVFRIALPGARMKLVGGDSGRVEHEEFVDDVVLAPSERAVVDVLFERPGELALEHRTPHRTYRLAAITVTEQVAEPPLGEAFERCCARRPELAIEREHLDRWLAAPPDKVLAAVAEMDDPAATGGGDYVCPMPEVVEAGARGGMRQMAAGGHTSARCTPTW